ncbi:TIGR02186 family protein [Frigidibacter sp. RF13]|uniref:TIGR02186 family protein n=1 Tax=Frigidibacter sp. RF13 TaxID=2997340 RepID=UPI0022720942|nr:TIGR02186 family protein [Frigidibacter sp. RF13]MCY1126195.1 TIGR02186 family protein [Frigidibacter sp. RF13]
MKRFIIAAFLAFAGPVLAEEDVVAGLSQDRIDITANFDGSDILIYGAVKRDAPVPPGALDVIITLEGPGEAEVVRRKARVLGLWINTDKVVIDRAPSFYAVATTGAFSEIISDTEDLRHAISIPRAIRSVGAPQTIQDSQTFTEALIRIREARHLYSLDQYAVRLTDQTLFRADFDLPANLVEGNYKTRIFLLRDKRVVNLYEKTIFVRKVGLERWLFNLSRQQPAAYGLLALVIAALAGWGASAGFRLLRR